MDEAPRRTRPAGQKRRDGKPSSAPRRRRGPDGQPRSGAKPQKGPRSKPAKPSSRATASGGPRGAHGKPRPGSKPRTGPSRKPGKRRRPKERRKKPTEAPGYFDDDMVDEMDDMDVAAGDEELDDPFAKAEETEPETPQGLDSDHAEHMSLLESSKVLATPAVWLLGVLDGLIMAAGVLLAVAAVTEPAFRVQFALAGGFALLAGAAIAFSVVQGRKRFARACQEAHFDVRRSVSPERVTFGDVISARLDATQCVFEGADVTLKDRPSPGFETGRRVLLNGPEMVDYKARATRRGVQPLAIVDVLMKDPGGLWRHTRSYEVPANVEVNPGMAALTLRNMLNSRTAFPDDAPKALVNLFRDIEHDQLRAYHGGDRMKDVDWKRMSSTGQMMVKDRIVESLDVGLLLIDAGTSMRLVEDGKRNLDHALEAASEIVQEAGRRNHQIGFLAFDDARVVAQMSPTRSRMLYRETQERFQEVAARHVDDEDAADEPVAVSLQRALRGMVGSNMGVLLFSDLETIDEGIVQVLTRLGGDGAKVGVLILPQPSLDAKRRAYRRDLVKPARGAYRGKGHRRELREVLAVQGIETMDLRID